MNEKVYCCKVKDNSKTPDLTTEFLSTMDVEFSCWSDRKEKIFFHTIYCENEQEAKEVSIKLQDLSEGWKEFGVELSDIELFSIKKEDWSEVWKKYFKIRHLSERIVIKPTWLDYTPQNEELIIELDPGMSFGTGHHPTTGFCLKMIDELSQKNDVNTFLDAGCGSGILSIAAHKLGLSPITAFDIDSDAIIVSNENFEQNKIKIGDIDLREAALEEFGNDDTQYDLIAANILVHILVANRERLVSMVRPGGYLILAGILTEEFDKTKKSFCELGLKEIKHFTEKEWTSGVFQLGK